MMWPVMCDTELSPKMDLQKERMKYLLANAIHELWKKETGSLSAIYIEGTICITSSSGKTTVVQVSDRFVSQLSGDGLSSNPYDVHGHSMVSPSISRGSNASVFHPSQKDYSVSNQFSPSGSSHSYVNVHSPATEDGASETPRTTPNSSEREVVVKQGSLSQQPQFETPHRDKHQKAPVKKEFVSEDSDSETELASPKMIPSRPVTSPKKRSSSDMYKFGVGAYVPGTGVYVNACDTRGCVVNSNNLPTDFSNHQRSVATVHNMNHNRVMGYLQHGFNNATKPFPEKMNGSQVVDLSHINDASPPKIAKQVEDSVVTHNNNNEKVSNNNYIGQKNLVCDSRMSVLMAAAGIHQEQNFTNNRYATGKTELNRNQASKNNESNNKADMASSNLNFASSNHALKTDKDGDHSSEGQICGEMASPDSSSRRHWAPVVYDRNSLKLTIEASPNSAPAMTSPSYSKNQVNSLPPSAPLSVSTSSPSTSVTMVTDAAQGLMSLSAAAVETPTDQTSTVKDNGSVELQEMLKRRNQIPALLRARVLANQQAAAAINNNNSVTSNLNRPMLLPPSGQMPQQSASQNVQHIPRSNSGNNISYNNVTTSPVPTSPSKDLQSSSTHDMNSSSDNSVMSPSSPCDGSPDSDKTSNADFDAKLDAGGEQRSYKCDYCGKIFHFKSKYHEHLPVHTNARPYQCHLCSRTYKYKYDLRVHLRTHMGIPTKSSVCPFCSHKCDSNKLLRLHIQEQHRDQQKITEAECSTEEMSPALWLVNQYLNRVIDLVIVWFWDVIRYMIGQYVIVFHHNISISLIGLCL